MEDSWACQTTTGELTFCDPASASERERVTCSNLASTMINILVNNPLMGALDLSNLRIVSCGGSPLSQATYSKAVSMFGCEFFISYGAPGYAIRSSSCCVRLNLLIPLRDDDANGTCM